MRHLLTFAGKNLADFGVHISGEDTWKKPAADYEQVSVPGRNGDLLFFNNRYNNVEIKYSCGIVKDFDANFTALAGFLLSNTGYQRLEDSYHPDCFRLAYFKGELSPQMTRLNREGQFDLVFEAKPQMFLKSGEQKIIVTPALNPERYIYNPTQFAAKPLIRIYGTGSVVIGNRAIVVLTADEYTDVDCELGDAYKGDTNCNTNIYLTGDGAFPEFLPGSNWFSIGVSRVEVMPRWWKL